LAQASIRHRLNHVPHFGGAKGSAGFLAMP
jgi:hypothetical protein